MMELNFKSEIVTYEDWPDEKSFHSLMAATPKSPILFICDQTLKKHLPKWMMKSSGLYFVKAGEELKDLNQFSSHVLKISKILESTNSKKVVVVGIGGGSVGDFSGFFASTFKRGVQLVSVPTTWLAAIDSAHGGKNALNVNNIKNQLGTFYPASKVLLIKSILSKVSNPVLYSALGEWIKIGFINRPQLLEKLSLNLKQESTELGSFLWEHLPQAIEGKMEVVLKDPYETKGERQKLNLGHTLGHAIEGHFGWPHGLAIFQGLIFSLHWSLKKEFIDKETYQSILQKLEIITSKTESPLIIEFPLNQKLSHFDSMSPFNGKIKDWKFKRLKANTTKSQKQKKKKS